MARPTKLTPNTQKQITQALRMGATYDLACKFAGISYQSFRNWITRAEDELTRVSENTRASIRKGEQPYIELFEAVQKAEGDAAIGWLAKIEKAANEGNWQAAAWKLERRYSKHYNRNHTEHTGADGGAIQWSQVMVVDPDEHDDPFA